MHTLTLCQLEEETCADKKSENNSQHSNVEGQCKEQMWAAAHGLI